MQQISTVGLKCPMLGWPVTRQGMLATWCMWDSVSCERHCLERFCSNSVFFVTATVSLIQSMVVCHATSMACL